MRHVAGISLVLVLAAPASADWLSLKDGQLLETKGPWTERGRMIVYTDPVGHLLSIRASEVDLEVSREIGKLISKPKYVEIETPPDPEMATDVTDEREAEERAKLQRHVTDPNSVKVSGTLSAQSDEVAERILSRELADDQASRAYQQALKDCELFAPAKQDVCILRARIWKDQKPKKDAEPKEE